MGTAQNSFAKKRKMTKNIKKQIKILSKVSLFSSEYVKHDHGKSQYEYLILIENSELLRFYVKSKLANLEPRLKN